METESGVVGFLETDFPEPSITLGSFQEQFVSFYFHLNRKSCPESIDTLGVFFSSLLKNPNCEVHYMYRLIAQTRDIVEGKGEHDLAYMMIWKLHSFFPKLSVRMIRAFVQPRDAYGSWRDIKYLCQYIRQHSNLGSDDPLIHFCVQLMNEQLKKDLTSWKFSKHAFSRDHISNVAKWIPREHKKFDWLYEKLVIDWTKQRFPLLLQTSFSLESDKIIESYHRAIKKAKRLYRKVVSLLNKGLNTTEIRLCANTTNLLLPQDISKFTLMKQPTLLFEKESSENLQQFYKEKYNLTVGSPGGFTEGSPNGFTEGYPGGFTEGYPNGFTEGYPGGFTKGYPNGFTEGSPNGFTEGYPNGFTEGYPGGFTEGYPGGFTEGYPGGFTEGSTIGSSSQTSLTSVFPTTVDYQEKQYFTKKIHSVLPLSYFVEKGIFLSRKLGEFTETTGSGSPLQFEIQLLNAQWSELLNLFPSKFENLLPILDVSFPMQHPDKESFYTGIGMALLLSELSTFGKRVLVLDNLPTWINLEDTTDFISKIQRLDIEIQSCQNTFCNYFAGIDWITQCLGESNMPRNYIHDLELVWFSNFYGVNMHHQSIYDIYAHSQKSFSKVIDASSHPRMVFWNLDKGDVTLDMEHLFSTQIDAVTNPRLRFFSGFSPLLLRCLFGTKRMTAYESICKILDQKRYRVLDSHLPSEFRKNISI